MEKLGYDFYNRDCLTVAPELIGKIIVREVDGKRFSLRITETEAYRGTGDTACHASKGRTKKSELLWWAPATVYIYLCYGIHWMLNVITGEKEQPQGILIRACAGAEGPGKTTKALQIDESLNGRDFVTSEEIWIADDGMRPLVGTDKRVGIDYADTCDRDKLWRFVMLAGRKSI